MVPETLVTIDLLQHKGVALAQGKSQLFYNAKNFLHDLLMQLCIRGVSDGTLNGLACRDGRYPDNTKVEKPFQIFPNLFCLPTGKAGAIGSECQTGY